MKLKSLAIITFALFCLSSANASQKRDAYRCILNKNAGGIQSYEMTQFQLIKDYDNFWHEFEDANSQLGVGVRLSSHGSIHRLSIVTVNRSRSDDKKEYQLGIDKNQKYLEFYSVDSEIELKLTCYKTKDAVVH